MNSYRFMFPVHVKKQKKTELHLLDFSFLVMIEHRNEIVNVELFIKLTEHTSFEGKVMFKH